MAVLASSHYCRIGSIINLRMSWVYFFHILTVTQFLIFITLESLVSFKTQHCDVVIKDGDSVYRCHWRTAAHRSKLLLVSVCVLQKYILGPKGSLAKWLFFLLTTKLSICLPLDTGPSLSGHGGRTLNADYTARCSWTSSRTLYCNTVIFRQADANKYLWLFAGQGSRWTCRVDE